MPAIANGGCQNTLEPLSCRGSGASWRKIVFGSRGTRVPVIFRRHFAEEKAPSCSRLVLGFLAPGVHGLKKAGVEMRCPV